jgi:hypothetical protein
MGPHFGYVDKFIGNDFMLWKFKKETMLKAKKLWGLIDGKNVKLGKSETIAIFTYMQRKSHAFNLIVQSLYDNQLLAIKRKITMNGI